MTTAARQRRIPDVPSIGETVPGYDASTWYGLGAPKNTPAEIVAQLNAATNAALAEPAHVEHLAGLGFTVKHALTGGIRGLYCGADRQVGQGDSHG